MKEEKEKKERREKGTLYYRTGVCICQRFVHPAPPFYAERVSSERISSPKQIKLKSLAEEYVTKDINLVFGDPLLFFTLSRFCDC